VTFDVLIKKYPPVLVRLLARTSDRNHRPRALTSIEIGAAAGLPQSVIYAMSRSLSWSEWTIGQFLAFTRACQIDMFNPVHRRRLRQYVGRAPKWTHLEQSQDWPELKQLVEILRQRKVTQ
jgi:hypothetical protein